MEESARRIKSRSDEVEGRAERQQGLPAAATQSRQLPSFPRNVRTHRGLLANAHQSTNAPPTTPTSTPTPSCACTSDVRRELQEIRLTGSWQKGAIVSAYAPGALREVGKRRSKGKALEGEEPASSWQKQGESKE